MEKPQYTVHYSPVHPGTDKTEIHFFDTPEKIADHFCADNSQNFRRVYVTDTAVSCLPAVQKILSKADSLKDIIIILGAGETYKTLESVTDVVSKAIDAGMNRSDIFVGIGGGVICDMTAFAASVFKRGAKLELIPTTLLAMVDAALGGKTGCDFSSYKNMIGTFYPASTLLTAPAFVSSLPESEYRSGLAEVLKTGLLYSKQIVDLMEKSHTLVLSRDEKTVSFLVSECMKAKGSVVEKDLTESGIRMQLNLGHTFAHALETCAGLGTITHGDAVAWGIGRAAELSVILNTAKQKYADTVSHLLSLYGWYTGKVHPAAVQSYMKRQTAADIKNLHSTIAKDIVRAMKKDKKNTSAAVRLILQKDIGDTYITEVNEDDILAVLA